ncbi:hypothetical protein PspLS_09333 [Pyricularia sp. CBS 133598]|nr:hypothetical protein PspLS_09333 [Pyricularia sp. CBS 133598]
MKATGKICAAWWPLLLLSPSIFFAQSCLGHNDESYTWRLGASLAVMGDFLYIQGGQAVLPDSLPRRVTVENRTFAIPLTESWSKSTINMDDLGYANKGYEIIATIAPAIWTVPENKQLLLWGGEAPAKCGNDGSEDARLRKYTPDGSGGMKGSWGSGHSKPTAVSSQDRIYRGNGGSWTQCNGRGFYLGGAVNNRTDEDFPGVTDEYMSLSGLLIYDFEKETWRNRSIENFGNGDGKYTWGSAVCLPTLGTKGEGIVVFVGGSFANLFYAESNQNQKMLPMDNIIFYDIGSDQFHKQRTTGTPPKPRHVGCIVAAKAADTKTYEIVAYGGCKGAAEVDILTIPGFHWISAGSIHDSGKTGRQYHSCAIIGKGARQMVAYGGIRTDITFNWTTIGDVPNPWGESSLEILDMTELEWKEGYDSNAPNYQQPAEVRDWYKSFGLENVSWDGNNRALFADIIDNPLGEEPLPDKGASNGAVVGSVVGGIVVLILVAVSLLYLCWYRPRRQGSMVTHEPMQPEVVEESSNRQSHGIANLYQPPPKNFNAHGNQWDHQHADSSKWCAELPSPPSSPAPHKGTETMMRSHGEGVYVFSQELPGYSEPQTIQGNERSGSN